YPRALAAVVRHTIPSRVTMHAPRGSMRSLCSFLFPLPRPPSSTLFPYTTLFRSEAVLESGQGWHVAGGFFPGSPFMLHGKASPRSEEHTSELQSRVDLVCRLLLEKKKRHSSGKDPHREGTHHRAGGNATAPGTND